MPNITKLSAAAAILIAAGQSASAAEETANLLVSATVADLCVVAAISPLAFAAVSTSADTNDTTTGKIKVTCTSDKDVTVKIGDGSNAVSAGGQRRMKFGANNFIPYGVYTSSARDADVPSTSNFYSGTVNAATSEIIDVFGKIPAGPYSAGEYTDTLVVTMSYNNPV